MIPIPPFWLSGFFREAMKIKKTILLCGVLLFMPQGLYAVPHSGEFDPIFWETRCECEEDWYCGFLFQLRSDMSSDIGCQWLSMNKYPGWERYPAAPLEFSNYEYRYFKPNTASQESDSSRDPLFPEKVRHSEKPGSQEKGDEDSILQPLEIETQSDEETDLVKDSRPAPADHLGQADEPKNDRRVQEKAILDAAEQEVNHKPPQSIRPSSINYPEKVSAAKDKRETQAPFPNVYKSPTQKEAAPTKSRSSQSNSSNSAPKKIVEIDDISIYDPYLGASIQTENSVSALLPQGTDFNLEDLKEGPSRGPLMTSRYKMESIKINIENGGLGDALWVVIAFSIEKMFLIFSKFTAAFKYLMNPFSFFGVAICAMVLLGISQTHRE